MGGRESLGVGPLWHHDVSRSVDTHSAAFLKFLNSCNLAPNYQVFKAVEHSEG